MHNPDHCHTACHGISTLTLHSTESTLPWLSDARPAMARGRSFSPADSDLVPNGIRPKPPACPPVPDRHQANVKRARHDLCPSCHAEPTRSRSPKRPSSGMRFRRMAIDSAGLVCLATLPQRDPDDRYQVPTTTSPPAAALDHVSSNQGAVVFARISLGNVKHHYSFPPPPVVR